MRSYILRRLLGAIPLLLVISVICFTLIRLAPGGPLARLEGNPNVRAEDIEIKRKILGLDEPYHIQYLIWAKRMLVELDFGESFVTGRPVLDMIVERLPATIELMGTAFVLAVLIGLTAGVFAAVYRARHVDYVVTFLAFIGISLPVFWLGLMGQIVFAAYLGWLPASNRFTIGVEPNLLDYLHHLILPASVLSLLYMSSWSRYMRGSLLEVLDKDFVRTARAKGVGRVRVIVGHAVRNALVPVVTVMALQIPTLFTGAIITETIFSWPGMGLLFYDGILKGDYPRVQAILVISSALIVTFNLVADIVYGILDPRISYE